MVDLWGGIRNEATGEPWEEDTMVIVFSATKGLSAMAMALAHSRGLLDSFGSPAAFGSPGSGGSFGFADPQAGLGYGYVLNGMGMSLEDPRDVALRTAMYRSIGERRSGSSRYVRGGPFRRQSRNSGGSFASKQAIGDR